MTHELARSADMDDYFAKKFHPMEVLYVVGRSYASSPTCTPPLVLVLQLEGAFLHGTRQCIVITLLFSKTIGVIARAYRLHCLDL